LINESLVGQMISQDEKMAFPVFPKRHFMQRSNYKRFFI